MNIPESVTRLSSRFNHDFSRYFLVGGLAALVNWTVFYVLHPLMEIHYVVAAVGAFFVAWLVNATLTITFAFPGRERFSRGAVILLLLVVSLIGALLDVVLLGVFYRSIGLGPMVSKVLASALVLGWNFTARRYFIFTSPGGERRGLEAMCAPALNRLARSPLGRVGGGAVLLAVTLTSLLFTAFYLESYTPAVPWKRLIPVGDTHEYHRLAFNLKEGRGYSYEIPGGPILDAVSDAEGKLLPEFSYLERWLVPPDKETLTPNAARSPGYPFILAATYWLGGKHGVVLARISQSLALGLAALLLFWAARRLRPGLFVALALTTFVLNDELYPLAAHLLTDVWAVLFLGLVFVTIVANRGRNPWLDALAGALLAFDLLIRPNHVFVVPLYGLYLLWETPGWVPRIRRALAFGVAFILILAPWTLRNASHFGAVIPFSTQGGHALATYNCDLAYERMGQWGEDISPEVRNKADSFTDPIEKQAFYMGLFKAWVRENPNKMAKMVIWRTPTTWFSGLYSVADDEFRIRRLPFTLMLLFVPLGLWLGRRERWVQIAFLFLLAHQIQAWLFSGQLRYLLHFQITLSLLGARGMLGLLEPGLRICWDTFRPDEKGPGPKADPPEVST